MQSIVAPRCFTATLPTAGFRPPRLERRYEDTNGGQGSCNALENQGNCCAEGAYHPIACPLVLGSSSLANAASPGGHTGTAAEGTHNATGGDTAAAVNPDTC